MNIRTLLNKLKAMNFSINNFSLHSFMLAKVLFNLKIFIFKHQRDKFPIHQQTAVSYTRSVFACVVYVDIHLCNTHTTLVLWLFLYFHIKNFHPKKPCEHKQSKNRFIGCFFFHDFFSFLVFVYL